MAWTVRGHRAFDGADWLGVALAAVAAYAVVEAVKTVHRRLAGPGALRLRAAMRSAPRAGAGGHIPEPTPKSPPSMEIRNLTGVWPSASSSRGGDTEPESVAAGAPVSWCLYEKRFALGW